MSQVSDTTPEAERVWRRILRQMPLEKKWHQMDSLYRTARILHATGFRDRHPGAGAEEIQRDWQLQTLGKTIFELEIRIGMDEPSTLDLIQKVIQVFNQLSIPCALGGSWASSLQGKMRFTHDADLTVEPFLGLQEELINKLSEEFYVSLGAVEDALKMRSSFNVIHFSTGFKIDIFVRKDRPFDQALMARSRLYQMESSGPSIPLLSPEDIVLIKLEWYRLGGEVSEQQWKDVLGVMEVQGEQLDQDHLEYWAEALGVSDLLEKALEESRGEE